KGCPARLIVYQDGTFKEKNVHMNHIPSSEKVKKYELVAHAKNLVRHNLTLPMNEVLTQVENMMGDDDEVAPEMGSTENLKRKIRTARRQLRGEIPTGRT